MLGSNDFIVPDCFKRIKYDYSMVILTVYLNNIIQALCLQISLVEIELNAAKSAHHIRYK